MMDKRQALRQNIDGKIADYIDEVDRIQTEELHAENHRRRKGVEAIRADLAELRADIEQIKLRLDAEPKSDDKYAITKAKLVQLMKDMGYYD